MSLDALQSLIQSSIPGPVTRYGRAFAPPQPVSQVVYDGTPLPRFLYNNGGDPEAVRQFLRLNRIGNPFELEVGRLVVVERR